MLARGLRPGRAITVAYSSNDCRQLAGHTGAWLVPTDKCGDVVVSCRMRLARNLETYPFVVKLDESVAKQVAEELREHLTALSIDGETTWIGMGDAPPVLRLMLRERHLISRDLSPTDGELIPPGRGVAFGPTETLSVMVNEEDHLRIQGLAAGFDLERARDRAIELDRQLEERVPFAFTKQLGYLTGCPTNVGTGLRASVMLHLPGLGMVQSELEKVFTAAQRTGLAVRGLHGEGTRAAGDFYQISNQVTLGRSEEDLIDDLRALVPVIVKFERKVRETLLKDQRSSLEDRVQRSYGLLRSSMAMPTEAALAHLSNIRLGFHLSILSGIDIDDLNLLGVQIQRGHIQALECDCDVDSLLEVSERDRLRAGLLRRRLMPPAG